MAYPPRICLGLKGYHRPSLNRIRVNCLYAYCRATNASKREIPLVRQSHPETLDSENMETVGSLDSARSETPQRSQVEPNNYVLQLNRTQLLFIPPLDPDSRSGTVVQVCVRGDVGVGDIFNVFRADQASITTTIETLLVGHISTLHKLPKCVTIKEVVPGYALTGRRKPWEYGRGKKFCLGDAMLQPAEDKWVFHFEKAE